MLSVSGASASRRGKHRMHPHRTLTRDFSASLSAPPHSNTNSTAEASGQHELILQTPRLHLFFSSRLPSVSLSPYILCPVSPRSSVERHWSVLHYLLPLSVSTMMKKFISSSSSSSSSRGPRSGAAATGAGAAVSAAALGLRTLIVIGPTGAGKVSSVTPSSTQEAAPQRTRPLIV
jgi:hypothetical protein